MSEAEDVAFKEMFPLVIGLLAGLAVFFIVIAKIIAATTVETTYAPSGMTVEEAISKRVAPIGQVNMGGPMLAAADAGGTGAAAADGGEPQSAEEIYSGVCAACHDNGVAGAPVLGETGTWQGRLDERGSYDALYRNALNGIGAMPAKGGANISEEELDETVRYILEESGLSP